jgi:hypothetical protein
VDFYDGSRRPGVELVRGFIAERSDDAWQPPDSVLGAKLWSTLGALIAPFAPRREAPFPWWPDRPYRVDVLLPRPKIIIEADGRAWHARVRDFDRDRWRDNEAVAHGYAVLRFTWVHLTCSPNDVVRLVRRTLAERLHAAAPDQRAG